jgi:hypothetical protein
LRLCDAHTLLRIVTVVGQQIEDQTGRTLSHRVHTIVANEVVRTVRLVGYEVGTFHRTLIGGHHFGHAIPLAGSGCRIAKAKNA